MNDASSIDFALLLLRTSVGVVMFAHGVNHIFGGGKIEGTAGWFASLGMRYPKTQAWLASITEVAAGTLLVVGLLTPFAAAGIVGVMFVAWMINHRGNGFFIFRPGEGWEYIMVLLVVGLVVGILGPGQWSLDEVLKFRDELSGWRGGAICAGAGLGGALAILAAFWRPQREV